MTPTQSVLDVQAIWGYYGPVPAVRDITFSLRAGECLSVVGPNGAGKSSLLKAICGIVRSRGSVSLRGRGIDGLSTGHRFRAGLGYMPQERGVVGPMTVRENLRLAWIAGTKRTPFEALVEDVFQVFPELELRRAHSASLLSGGQRQMLGIGKTLLMSPDVLLLDEPTAGLSPALISRIIDALTQIRALGSTMILVEQNSQAALRLADRFLTIHGGEAIYQGSKAEFLEMNLARKLVSTAQNPLAPA